LKQDSQFMAKATLAITSIIEETLKEKAK